MMLESGQNKNHRCNILVSVHLHLVVYCVAILTVIRKHVQRPHPDKQLHYVHILISTHRSYLPRVREK